MRVLVNYLAVAYSVSAEALLLPAPAEALPEVSESVMGEALFRMGETDGDRPELR